MRVDPSRFKQDGTQVAVSWPDRPCAAAIEAVMNIETAIAPGTSKENAMATNVHAVSSADIKRAIENRDGGMLASMYADDAVMRVIDPSNPPSKPREIKGKTAIGQYWDDVCGRTMTHKVETSVTDGNRLAFTQACTYPEGGKVFCVAMLDLKDGKIVRQTAVQVWDE
jgi:hypothetical protein